MATLTRVAGRTKRQDSGGYSSDDAVDQVGCVRVKRLTHVLSLGSEVYQFPLKMIPST